MPSPADDLLGILADSCQDERRPWGTMRSLGSRAHGLTVKYLQVEQGHRTSLQRHNHKDELIVVLGGTGCIEAGHRIHSGDGCVVRITPGVIHRVTGPLSYLEVSTYDDGTDTIRLHDDYDREP
jgi:mannose-6-phosphate isomerase-like protein (cupin superfamily)